jgi:hypothetical protein
MAMIPSLYEKAKREHFNAKITIENGEGTSFVAESVNENRKEGRVGKQYGGKKSTQGKKKTRGDSGEIKENKENKLDNEIFLTLFEIYKSEGNTAKDLIEFSETKLKKLLSQNAFDRLKSGRSPLGKIQLYGGSLGQYYALNVRNGDFYKRLKKQHDKGKKGKNEAIDEDLGSVGGMSIPAIVSSLFALYVMFKIAYTTNADVQELKKLGKAILMRVPILGPKLAKKDFVKGLDTIFKTADMSKIESYLTKNPKLSKIIGQIKGGDTYAWKKLYGELKDMDYRAYSQSQKIISKFYQSLKPSKKGKNEAIDEDITESKVAEASIEAIEDYQANKNKPQNVKKIIGLLGGEIQDVIKILNKYKDPYDAMKHIMDLND